MKALKKNPETDLDRLQVEFQAKVNQLVAVLCLARRRFLNKSKNAFIAAKDEKAWKEEKEQAKAQMALAERQFDMGIARAREDVRSQKRGLKVKDAQRRREVQNEYDARVAEIISCLDAVLAGQDEADNDTSTGGGADEAEEIDPDRY